ncbi:hypothetical protein SUGI_0461940 [Cryptomeria japonica]|nr:hypothetical protein SUGI_0461940 [Cryptomeria japonica]
MRWDEVVATHTHRDQIDSDLHESSEDELDRDEDMVVKQASVDTCTISLTTSKISKPNFPKSGKCRGRKTEAEKLRMEALDSIDEGTQWTMEALLTRSRQKQNNG